MDKEQKRIARDLFEITEHIRVKFEHNKKDRDRIAEILKNNGQPNGYRVEWMTETALDVMDLIKKSSKEFNQNYIKDIATVDDMIDILQIVMNKFRPKD